MATVSQLPASCNLVCTVGNDFTLTLAVTENGSTWSSTGATLATDIYSRDGTVQATDFTTAATDGQVTLTLTDANTTALGVGAYSYRLSVTKSGNTRDWIAGTLSVVEAGIGGTTSSAASLSITTGTVSLSTTTLVAPAAANISVADAGGFFDGDTVEEALAEVPGLAVSLASGKGAVCFTWDDGFDNWTTIGNYAAARNQRHTFCVSLNRIGQGGFTDSDIVALAAQGHEIAAHSETHTKMTTLTASQRVTEWDTPKTYLENLLGAGSVTTWCYPYGSASTPSGRNAATDKEGYLRYDRLLDTTGLAGTGNYRLADPKPFLIRRIDWDPATPANYQTGLEWIRRAAVEPIVVVLYAHDPTTYMTEYEDAMDLAQSLGVPCVTTREAFPAHPNNLLDGGFEDSNLYYWTYNGSASQTMESIVDTPATGLNGTRSLHLATDGVTKTVYASQSMRVLPNEEYTLSFWDRVSITSTGGSSLTYAKVEVYDELANLLSSHYGSNLTNTSWAEGTVVMTGHPAAAFATVKLVVELIHAEAWFDHVHFGPTRLGVFGSISMTTVTKAASEITVADAGSYFAGTTAEAVLQNIGARVPEATTYTRLDRDNATRFLPTAAIAQSLNRTDINSQTFGFLTSGQQSFVLCWLPAGTVSSITFVSGTTAAVSPSNQWFSIYDTNRNKLAVTVDDTTTAWAGSATKTLSISGGYVVPTEGYYYIGIMVAASTVPTIIGVSTTATIVNTLPPLVSGRDTTNTGLTTPATAPATAAAFTSASGLMYCYVS